MLKEESNSFLPPTIPVKIAYANVALLEFLARLFRFKPIMARVQLDFITKGWEPSSVRAQEELGWQPLSLGAGIRKYLEDRFTLVEKVQI